VFSFLLNSATDLPFFNLIMFSLFDFLITRLTSLLLTGVGDRLGNWAGGMYDERSTLLLDFEL